MSTISMVYPNPFSYAIAYVCHGKVPKVNLLYLLWDVRLRRGLDISLHKNGPLWPQPARLGVTGSSLYRFVLNFLYAFFVQWSIISMV